MDRSSADTKIRLLDAAAVEFAEYGLAGARVDRLAKNARANKQLIYAYFGSKDGLFDAVLEQRVASLLEAVPFGTDLPDYAVRLFDFYCENYELVRLARWSELERPGALNALPRAVESSLSKVRLLEKECRAGAFGGRLDAAQILGAVVALTGDAASSVDDRAPRATRSYARESLRAVVTRLVRN